jgi:drug/metabolite transporter (DMT)-like permease
LIETGLITLAILLRILSNPVGNVFQKQLTSKGHHPLLVNFLTYLLLSIACIFIAVRMNWSVLPGDFWLYSILGGLAGGIGNGFLVKALEKGDLSVLGPINAYKSVVGLIVGIILLHEIPGVTGLLGVALIIYGSYFVLDTTEDRFSWALLRRPEIQFRLWAMVLTAIEAVFAKKVILASSTTVAFLSWSWFGMVFAFLFLLMNSVNVKTGVRKLSGSDVSKFIYLVICIGIMQITTNYSLQEIEVGYALAFFQLSIIVSVLLGHKIFKEKDIRKKLIGSVIMIAGSVLLLFS